MTDNFWDRIRDDNELARARQKLSIHDIRTIMVHARETSKAEIALRAILAEPYGCPFCDSGKLRAPDNPDKGHRPECGYYLAELALAKPEPSNA